MTVPMGLPLRTSNEKVTSCLLTITLLLRFAIGVSQLFIENISPLVRFLFEAITFSAIVILIIRNRMELGLYKIDKAGIGLFLIGCSFFRWGIKDEPALIAFLFFFATGIGLFLYFRRERVLLLNISWYWIIIGILVGSVAALSQGLIVQRNEYQFTNFFHSIFLLFINFSVHLSHAAALEEPIFRGFLLGYLQSKNWGARRILLFQAGLFWIVHVNLIDNPLSFWVVLPIIGVILGILAWKSGSVATSMVAHAVYNAVLGIPL